VLGWRRSMSVTVFLNNMPTPSPVKGGKLPKAITMYARLAAEGWTDFTLYPRDYIGGYIMLPHIPVAILPTATKSQAARICAFYNAPPIQRNLIVADAIARTLGSGGTLHDYPATVKAVLNALGLGGEATQ
jgi:hypothetical protein